jgi:hypothetical protein
MSVVVGVFIVLAAVAVLAMTVLVLMAEWRGFQSSLRRIPPDRRRSAIVGAVGATLYMIAAGAVLIASPWGRASWLVFFGSVAVAFLAVTVAVAVTGARRKR